MLTLPSAVRPRGVLVPAPDAVPFELRYPAEALVVVAGMPGAGKTTLLRRLFGARRDGPLVLDSEAVQGAIRRVVRTRCGYRLYRPLVHTLHHLRIARALGRPGPVVVHETGTRPLARRWMAARAAAGGHEAHLILLDVPRELAETGQQARGRRVRGRSMDRHARAWAQLREAPHGPLDEGYASVVLVARGTAGALRAIRFD